MKTAGVTSMIDRWVAGGVITGEQARRMRADVDAPARHGGLVAEGLGYLGGTLVAAALSLVAGRYWAQLGSAGHPTVVAVAALLLAVAGAVVPRATRGPSARLRAILWLGACGSVAALVVASVVLRDLVLLVLTSAGALFILPAVLGLWFPGMLSVAVALLVAGLLLVGAAVVMARRRRVGPGGEGQAGAGRDTGRLLPAVSSAAVVLAVVTAVVLVAGR